MKIRELVSDFMVLTGGTMLVYGVWMLSTAAAWITAGIMLVIIGGVFGLEGRIK